MYTHTHTHTHTYICVCVCVCVIHAHAHTHIKRRSTPCKATSCSIRPVVRRRRSWGRIHVFNALPYGTVKWMRSGQLNRSDSCQAYSNDDMATFLPAGGEEPGANGMHAVHTGVCSCHTPASCSDRLCGATCPRAWIRLICPSNRRTVRGGSCARRKMPAHILGYRICPQVWGLRVYPHINSTGDRD